MTWVKRIYILIIKVNKLFSFFLSRCFLVKVWENPKKLWKHSPAARVPTAFLVLPNVHSCLYNSIETRYMFSISFKIVNSSVYTFFLHVRLWNYFFVRTKTVHWRNESFRKRPWKLVESGEEHVVLACRERTVNPSFQRWKRSFFQIAPFSEHLTKQTAIHSLLSS